MIYLLHQNHKYDCKQLYALEKNVDISMESVQEILHCVTQKLEGATAFQEQSPQITVSIAFQSNWRFRIAIAQDFAQM